MSQVLRIATLVAATAFTGAAFAAAPCGNYKWDVAAEVQLFNTLPAPATAGTAAGTAPLIGIAKLHALTLHPQQQVRYAAPPSKVMLDEGVFGGLLRFRVDQAGPHRVAIDAGFWLDVVHEGRTLQSLDFHGDRECAGPRKIVVYDLPAGAELILQIAAATSATAKLAVTPVAAGAH